MKFTHGRLALWLAIFPVWTSADELTALDAVEVVAEKIQTMPHSSTSNGSGLAALRAATSDSAQLLQDQPGVTLYGAGGVSSLPAIHGLADERVRVQVDGMDLMAACPNHMNSPLSYIDPTRVATATVFAGITPVSVGGDSLGGTIQVNSAAPQFSQQAGETLMQGQAGTFWRSNGNAHGVNAGFTLASQDLSLSYNGSKASAGNYTSARAFKPAGSGAQGGPWLDGNTVGSSAYHTENHDLGLAFRHGPHLLQTNLSTQRIPFEGYPNQRMDMTANRGAQLNLHYQGQYEWGELDARLYRQDTQHEMNMGADRVNYGALGMPMNTRAQTLGASLQATLVANERDLIRSGFEYQDYSLNDWWPPVGGSMGPNTFWNIDYGRRTRAGVFSEWEAQWDAAWLSQFGVRASSVRSDAGPVQGYNSGGLWVNDAVAFNAKNRQRNDTLWDVTALSRYRASDTATIEGGYARKSRAPSLYERYPWSTQPMATLMNNFVGDGNGYVGNPNLTPEVAHTLSLSGDWHDAAQERWQIKSTAYYTRVQGYIDAQRCTVGQCGGAANAAAVNSFVNLTYANQSARLSGVDLSGNTVLFRADGYGRFTLNGVLGYVTGTNLNTGDHLYHIMPLNLKLAVMQQLGGWRNTVEVRAVSAKTRVSQVRNEAASAAYGLLNLRSSYEWQHARLDFGLENALNRQYEQPLGGAYVGQGASMGINNIPWGVALPGMGRSFNLALSVNF